MVGVEFETLGLDRKWSERAVSCHLSGHALPQLTFARAISDKVQIRMRVDVDEAG